MPACARREIVAKDQIGVYHCTARCVRRAFLCGKDPVSGRDLEHRKEWVRHRLESLAGFFAIDVVSYAVMSNHLHVILRARPDVVAAWSDVDVARRWARIKAVFRRLEPAKNEPEEGVVKSILSDRRKVAEYRERLTSVSWFMRLLCEVLARLANAEDKVKGKFWEGRFGSMALLDEAAILTCSMYVDLNPIRANIAETPEESKFTSAHDRIEAMKAKPGRLTRAAKRLLSVHKKRKMAANKARFEAGDPPSPDAWLCEVTLREGPGESPLVHRSKVEPAAPGPAQKSSAADEALAPVGPRASDRGFLPISLAKYLTLLDWTGREIREGKSGSIPRGLKPILERLGLNSETWVDLVANFGRWFKRAVGRGVSMAAEAERTDRRWFHGQKNARVAFL